MKRTFVYGQQKVTPDLPAKEELVFAVVADTINFFLTQII